MESVISIKNLNKKFEDFHALKNINLELEENKIYGILGRNAVGKSTLLKIIAGHYKANSGSLKFKGEEYTKNPSNVKHVCYVSDKTALFDNFNVKEILKDSREAYENWDTEMEKRLINEFKVNIKKNYKKLSSGMKGIVAIIIGICSRTDVTIFDESYIGLDAVNRSIFYRILMNDYMENPRTIIISTHFMDEVANLFEEIILINDGELVQKCNIEDIEEKALILSGNREVIEKYIPRESILQTETIGSFCKAHIDYRLDDNLRIKLKSHNVEIARDSLQNWFVNYVIKQGGNSHEK